MFTLRGDEAMPALLDVVLARLLFSSLFRGDVNGTGQTRDSMSPSFVSSSSREATGEAGGSSSFQRRVSHRGLTRASYPDRVICRLRRLLCTDYRIEANERGSWASSARSSRRSQCLSLTHKNKTLVLVSYSTLARWSRPGKKKRCADNLRQSLNSAGATNTTLCCRLHLASEASPTKTGRRFTIRGLTQAP